jgi:hypothetical protein
MDNTLQLDPTWKLSQDKNFLPELGINHPFGRICCKSRTMNFTECDWTCGWCKIEMNKFRQIEPIRLKANDLIVNGGDPSYEALELAVYQNNLERRIQTWRQKKQKIISDLQEEYNLYKRVEARILILQKEVFSPEAPLILQ